MKRWLILIVMFTMLTGCTSLQVGNTLYATAIGTTVVDWGQTRSIVRHADRYHEINPILGPHPTYAQVDRYFPVALGLIIFSYPIAKPEWRPYLYGAITLLESVVITSNFRHGLHMDFVAMKF